VSIAYRQSPSCRDLPRHLLGHPFGEPGHIEPLRPHEVVTILQPREVQQVIEKQVLLYGPAIVTEAARLTIGVSVGIGDVLDHPL